MIKKTVYIAHDGEEFENEFECLEYEQRFEEPGDFIRLYDDDFKLIKWEPENFDGMWDKLFYIVIAPHREQDAEKWFKATFWDALNVSPFNDICDWDEWKNDDHGDEPTIIAFSVFGDDCWQLLNVLYEDIKYLIRGLGLMDALN